MLSISRAPVSDAIRRLTVEGLLEILPQVGCRVVRPVPAEVKDLYEIFGATEGVIARMAAERRSAGEADEFATPVRVTGCPTPAFPTIPMPASSSSGSAIAAAMKGCTSSPARRSAPISGRPIGTAATSIIRVTFGGRGLPAYVRAGHAAFVAAVVAGDGKTAEHATRHYLVRLGQDVAAVLERQGREERR